MLYDGQNYVNGAFTNSDQKFVAYSPTTEESYGQFPVTSEIDVGLAVTAARVAQPEWNKVSRVKRAEYFDVLSQLIKKNHNNLQHTISIETGKNLNEAHAEVIEALHMCQVVAATGRNSYGEVFSSELATKDVQVIRKPRGVVAVISPWNFPCAIGSFWSSAPAIVEGNTVVHKPSELTPLVNDIIAKLYAEAGFPSGVYNLIHGASETGKALVRSDVDVILFTGSADVAKEIKQHCAGTFNKTCSIECGSKSATMVFADGDLDLAVDASIASAFKLSGQRCVSSSRILIERHLMTDFREAFVAKAKNIKMLSHYSLCNESDFVIGPVISDEQLRRVLSFNALTMNDPDVVVHCVGEKLPQKGHFLSPHVYECEWADKTFLKQEVFGPHVALIPFNDLDDAIRIYNDTEYGLALGVITDDFRKHREIAQRCTAGMIYINGGSIAAESHVPFSSWKKSGYGASASATWKAVTHTTTITTNYEQGKVQFAQGMK
jgi:aldehyde dehydrogenase (NAD+)